VTGVSEQTKFEVDYGTRKFSRNYGRLRTNHGEYRFDLREAMDQFQGLCLMITPERNVPIDLITEARQTHKKIQDQLTKISGARQLLEGKYRQYHRRDHRREKEIMEIAFLAKSLYLTLEYTLQEMEAKKKLKDRGELLLSVSQHTPFRWFQSAGNQIVLLRNLETLSELDYKTRFELGFERRREAIQDGMRSISLFAFSGEIKLIDTLQSRMQFENMISQSVIKKMSSVGL